LAVASDQFEYKLKNKYSCLTNTHNEFAAIDVPEEASQCMNKYYDYKIEKCLEEYEGQFPKNDEGTPWVGFYGHNSTYNTSDDSKGYEMRRKINRDVGFKPEATDSASAFNVYWTLYGNLAKSDLIIDEEKPQTLEFNNADASN
jgi:hypothetical protein